MTWEQRYRLRRAARTSLVLWAGLALVAALVAAPTVLWLDCETGWRLFGFSPDGARAVLGALAGSMLTFIVFVLSATLIVVQRRAASRAPGHRPGSESPGIKWPSPSWPLLTLHAGRSAGSRIASPTCT